MMRLMNLKMITLQSIIWMSHAQLLYDVQQIALQMVVEADDTLTKKCKEIIQSNHAFFVD